MREILFRGKKFINDEWVEGLLVKDRAFYGKPENHAYIVNHECPSGCFGCDIYFEVDPDTVGQYTGMIDRNGKKIFEGDIVERYHRFGNEIARMYVVEHRGSWQLWDFDDNDDFLWNWCSLAYCHGEQVGGCIIIGNIHDNPELLEGGENYGSEQQAEGSAL